MKIEEKPLYKVFISGYPVSFMPLFNKAAHELGINLTVKYHGCVINIIDLDEKGNEITDASIEMEKIKNENIEADIFYKKTIGKNWLKKVEKLAKKMSK